MLLGLVPRRAWKEQAPEEKVFPGSTHSDPLNRPVAVATPLEVRWPWTLLSYHATIWDLFRWVAFDVSHRVSLYNPVRLGTPSLCLREFGLKLCTTVSNTLQSKLFSRARKMAQWVKAILWRLEDSSVVKEHWLLFQRIRVQFQHPYGSSQWRVSSRGSDTLPQTYM